MPLLTKLSIMQTPIPTIPEIAEMLRHHVNYDNDAPRLIVEHVFPLVGIDLTPDEVRNLRSTLEGQESRIDDLVEEKKNWRKCSETRNPPQR